MNVSNLNELHSSADTSVVGAHTRACAVQFSLIASAIAKAKAADVVQARSNEWLRPKARTQTTVNKVEKTCGYPSNMCNVKEPVQ